MAEQERLMVICAHIGDWVIRTGGTLAKYVREGTAEEQTRKQEAMHQYHRGCGIFHVEPQVFSAWNFHLVRSLFYFSHTKNPLL